MAITHGTAGADTITGTADADQLFGEGGNDVLKGSAGPDTLDGGAGRDTADYSGAAASVGVNLDGEPGFTGFAGDADGDVYVSVENLVGSSSGDSLFGDAAANRLSGGRGNDFLGGEGGNDTLIGGGGNDLVFAGSGAELSSGGGGARDTLSYQASVLGVNVNLSNGQVSGDAAGDTISGFENLIGSFGDDVLAGTLGANSIEGIGGADRLFGFAGDDLLRGGAGADTMTGGDGADLFFYDSAEDSPAGLFVRDVVLDFRHDQGDRIGLGPIDPFPGHAGDDAFEFLGKDALIDAPGQITYTFVNNTTVVQVNTEGGFASPPEMEIQLQGNIDLVASDFFL